MARVSIIFDGFEDLAYEISKLGDEPLHNAVDEALNTTYHHIQQHVRAAAAQYGPRGGKGYATGAMKAAVYTGGVEWSGSTASIGVGFDLEAKGGYHSIFIMYGTPRHAPGNNGGIKKDKEIYNAIRGPHLNEEIEAIQIKAMEKYLILGGKR